MMFQPWWQPWNQIFFFPFFSLAKPVPEVRLLLCGHNTHRGLSPGRWPWTLGRSWSRWWPSLLPRWPGSWSGWISPPGAAPEPSAGLGETQREGKEDDHSPCCARSRCALFFTGAAIVQVYKQHTAYKLTTGNIVYCYYCYYLILLSKASLECWLNQHSKPPECRFC